MKNITVLGAGTMGNGIAHVLGLKDFSVVMVDVSKSKLDTAMATISKNLERMVRKKQIKSEEKIKALININSSTDIKFAVTEADLVIEAVSEKEQLKKDIFKKVSEYVSPECILASNTSAISVTRLASVCINPNRFIGMHFMNPVPVMQLVEVIRAEQTDEKTLESILTLCNQIDKTPVVTEDYPGFVSNRVLMPMINEAIRCVQEGVGKVKAIDRIMKLGMGHPMGPLQLADFIGLDVCQSIMTVLYEGFKEPQYAPNPLLNRLVAAGKLGRKSGEGFYIYNDEKEIMEVALQFS